MVLLRGRGVARSDDMSVFAFGAKSGWGKKGKSRRRHAPWGAEGEGDEDAAKAPMALANRTSAARAWRLGDIIRSRALCCVFGMRFFCGRRRDR